MKPDRRNFLRTVAALVVGVVSWPRRKWKRAAIQPPYVVSEISWQSVEIDLDGGPSKCGPLSLTRHWSDGTCTHVEIPPDTPA